MMSQDCRSVPVVRCVPGTVAGGSHDQGRDHPVLLRLHRQWVGGDRVETHSISRGDEDAHFVKPKPSFALLLKDADLFVTTGLDLELWAPTLVDKSGNRRIRDGQPGFVSASQGVPLLDVPVVADRSAGDVHIYGNPHIFTSPLNAKIIAANIAAGLERVDPAGAEDYRNNLATFQTEIDERCSASRWSMILGGEVLDDLARQNRLLEFLESRLRGRATDRSAGWLARREPGLRDQQIVAYHKNWVYLTELLGLRGHRLCRAQAGDSAFGPTCP